MTSFILRCILIALAACSFTAVGRALASPAVTSISFTSTPAPTDQYAANMPKAAYHMSIPYTSSQAIVTYSDGSVKHYPLEYHLLFKSGDVIASGPHAGEFYGGIVDKYGAAVLDPNAAKNPFYNIITHQALAAGLHPSNQNQLVADTPDGSTLIQITPPSPSASSADLSYLTHFEYVTWDGKRKSSNQYRKNPMFIGYSRLNQNLRTGVLSIKSFDKLTFTGSKGLWTPCAASKSPWNTHLGSEEYEPDERAFDLYRKNPIANPLSRKSSTKNLITAFQKKFKISDARPYDYGYVTEVKFDQHGVATPMKHYATGRWSRELIKMMPDARTYYSGDDGSNTTLFMGVTDHKADLSSVTLYAAKVTQTSPRNAPAGAASLHWIRLGHANDAEIKKIIDSGITFEQIFDAYSEPLPSSVTAQSLIAQGFKRQFNVYHPSHKKNAEWLRLKPNMETAAAFLETHRYAAYKGATSEFTKMEGVALNAADKKTYIAISYQMKSMTTAGDIQFGRMDAGAVYALSMTNHQQDTAGKPINSAWVASNIAAMPLLMGRDNLPYVKGKGTADAQGNRCSVSHIANPDNLKFSAASRTLFIGEDSNCHVNNFVWAFNVDTHHLSRILSVPMGAEATGLMAIDDMNGFHYIGANYQHPGDAHVGIPPLALVSAVEKANPNFASERNRSGGVGYINFKDMPR